MASNTMPTRRGSPLDSLTTPIIELDPDYQAALQPFCCPHCGQIVILHHHARSVPILGGPRDLAILVGTLLASLLCWAALWWLVGFGAQSAAILLRG
jgi:hypothetical protein